MVLPIVLQLSELHSFTSRFQNGRLVCVCVCVFITIPGAFIFVLALQKSLKRVFRSFSRTSSLSLSQQFNAIPSGHWHFFDGFFFSFNFFSFRMLNVYEFMFMFMAFVAKLDAHNKHLYHLAHVFIVYWFYRMNEMDGLVFEYTHRWNDSTLGRYVMMIWKKILSKMCIFPFIHCLNVKCQRQVNTKWFLDEKR